MIPLTPIQIVEQSLSEHVHASCKASRVEIHWIGLAPDILPDDLSSAAWEGDACRSRPNLKVILKRTSAEPRSLAVRPQLALWRSAPVAATNTSPGQPVAAIWTDVPWDQLNGTILSTGIARSFIRAGEPLTTVIVEEPIDIETGSSIALHVRRGSLTISAPGKALERGRIGDTIRVINEATRVALTGVVRDSSTVEIP